ncbi:phage holin, partial [Lactococcus lactis]
MTKGTITRTILLWLAILNQILTALNMNPLPL